MMCAYNVRYHDYASTPIGEVANPDSYGTIQEYVSWESASTAIVNEAAKFMNGLDYAHIDRIEKTFITVKYYEGKIDREMAIQFAQDPDSMKNKVM